MSVPVYYNEIEPYAVAWLRNLMAEGLIPAGDIDTRSIEDVRPSDLAGYVQCHFFAGIGGWPLALALAGWPVDRPVWTGSCPCQPFSAAGKGAGFADERHLWPSFQHLIAQQRPTVVFGEQVASKDADPWIDLVHADMEGMGYAFGCVPFPSAGIGAPHIRDRNYWVADANDARLEGWEVPAERSAKRIAGPSGVVVRLAHAERIDSGREAAPTDHERAQANGSSDQRGGRGSSFVRLANADGIIGRQGSAIDGGRYQGSDAQARPGFGGGVMSHGGRPSAVNGFWANADWLGCTDGKWRPVESGTQPLAHGIPGRVGRLRAYGNAIVPQAAAAFIAAYAEARGLIDMEAVA